VAAVLAACRVIILSGNKFTSQLVRTLLPDLGINTVEICHEPGHAEAQLTTWLFDLVIVDAGPASGFDWLAMVEMLRTLPDKKQADTPAILLVSQPTKELVTRAAATQIRHVVAKPFTAGVLYGHIRCALGLGAYVPSRAFWLPKTATPVTAPPDLIV
jgi:CheY-like chemotaxis protein